MNQSETAVQQELFSLSESLEEETLSSKDRELPQVELSYDESRQIEKLLVDNYISGQAGDEQIIADLSKLKKITAEIKTIGKQSVVLQGERIFKAREILKSYGDGQNTFTQWLEKTYGNRRTGYNLLSFFELYKTLPYEVLRQKLKQMPLQAAYTLASREGAYEVKEDLVRNYQGEKQKDMILLIQERLPLSSTDKRVRKEANVRMLDEMEELFDTLEKRKESLSEKQKEKAQEFIQRLQRMFKS